MTIQGTPGASCLLANKTARVCLSWNQTFGANGWLRGGCIVESYEIY